MKQFKGFVEQILFIEENDERNLHHLQLNWTVHSEQLFTSLTLALLECMPSMDEQNANGINVEIKRLELIGEALIEKIFIVYTITDPDNHYVKSNDIENKRIQILKPTSLNEYAESFGLQARLLNPNNKNSTVKRQLY